MLVIKLLLTPALIGIVSLMGRRWGPSVSGWFIGLPLTSAPIVLFFALDHGTTFAAHAAQGTLLGLISGDCFCLVYSWLSFRVGWLGSLLLGWGAFFASTFVLEHISLPLVLAFVVVIICLVIMVKLFPDTRGKSAALRSPPWELYVRMGVAAVFVLLLTEVSSLLGPQLSGLLTPFPVFASILGAFTHHFQGNVAACRLLRGVVIGTFTFAVFFLVIAGAIAIWGIVLSFCLALLALLVLHTCSLMLMRRYTDTY
jgi:hypothetical protein